MRFILERLSVRQTDLGSLLGAENAYNTVHAWISGKTRLRYRETMGMLSEAGLLQPEAEAAWRGISLEAAELIVEAARARAAGAQAHPQAEYESPAPRRRKSA